MTSVLAFDTYQIQNGLDSILAGTKIWHLKYLKVLGQTQPLLSIYKTGLQYHTNRMKCIYIFRFKNHIYFLGICEYIWRSEDDSVGVCSLVLLCGFWRLNLGQQYRPLPTGLSHWPFIYLLSFGGGRRGGGKERRRGRGKGCRLFCPSPGGSKAGCWRQWRDKEVYQ